MPARRLLALIALVFLAAAPGAAGAHSPTLEAVRARGAVVCGVNTSLAGFAFPSGGDRWSGMNIDFCRALAAAVFGDPGKARFAPLPLAESFEKLKTGEVDVLVRNITRTSSREIEQDIAFGPITFYDGQGFMTRRAKRILAPKNLSDLPVCVTGGSTTELNLADYFRDHGLKARFVVSPDWRRTTEAYEAGRCDAITADVSGLHALRATFGDPEEHVILPQVISKEPLAPALRAGDQRWLQIVRWTHYAMVTAEDLGVGRATLDEKMTSRSAEVRRLLGLEGRIGPSLGLSESWARDVIRHVGNYGETFERNLGRSSPLRFNRGMNALWTEGGLMYAPPFR